MRTISMTGLGAPHQLEHRGEAEAALTGERGRIQERALFVAGAGETNADFVAAEYRIFSLGRRVLLIEDLALPAAVLRGIGAEIVERRVAAEDAAIIEQHHPGQPAFDAIKHPDVERVEPVGDAALADGAGDRRRRI